MFTVQWDERPIQSRKVIATPKESCIPISQPRSLQPLLISHLLSVCVDLPMLVYPCVARVSTTFLIYGWIIFCYMTAAYIVQLFTSWKKFEFFPLSGIGESPATDLLVQLFSVWICVSTLQGRCIPRNRIARSYESSLLNILRNC